MSARPRDGIDLHLHSTASDGLLAPAALVRRAAKEGLGVLSLTDHDTTAGLEEAAWAAKDEGIRLIPGIELTCRVRAGALGTVHVLGYGVDPQAPALADVGRRNRAGKRAQVRTIVDDLRTQERVDIPWEEITAGRDEDAYLGRHHVAAALVRRGLARSRRKAFRRYLRSERVAEAEIVAADEAVAAIHAAGGISVLAHPTGLDLAKHLKPLLGLGLRGLECYRMRQAPAHRERLLRLAEQHGLLVGGGSDWHGHHPEPPLGTWRPAPPHLTGLLGALS